MKMKQVVKKLRCLKNQINSMLLESQIVNDGDVMNDIIEWARSGSGSMKDLHEKFMNKYQSTTITLHKNKGTLTVLSIDEHKRSKKNNMLEVLTHNETKNKLFVKTNFLEQHYTNQKLNYVLIEPNDKRTEYPGIMDYLMSFYGWWES